MQGPITSAPVAVAMLISRTPSPSLWQSGDTHVYLCRAPRAIQVLKLALASLAVRSPCIKSAKWCALACLKPC